MAPSTIGDVHLVGDDGEGQHQEHQGPAGIREGDGEPAVHAVGDDTGEEAEEQPGSCCSVAPIATRKGSWVWEATRSGAAASANPSPRLLAHEDAQSQRKLVPRRAGRGSLRGGSQQVDVSRGVEVASP